MEKSAQLQIWRNWLPIFLERALTNKTNCLQKPPEQKEPLEHRGDSEDHIRNLERVKGEAAWKASHYHSQRLHMVIGSLYLRRER